MADFVGSTGGILKFARETDAQEVIIGTEQGIMHQLKKESPGKTFIPASGHLICRDMKRMTIDDILRALLEMKHVVRVPEETGEPARRALGRMLKASR
jgi:quinolinate synthase